MFKEFEEFKQAEAQINAWIMELSREVDQKKAEHTKAAATYKKMMVDDSAGVKSYTTADLNKAKMRVDELASEIQVAEERLRMVQDGKSEKLEAMLDKVKKGWERETKKLNSEIQGLFNAAREHRAKLTLEIQKGHEKYQQAQELLRALNQVEQIAGRDYNNRTTHLGVPQEPLLKEYHSMYYSPVTDKCVAPSEKELTDAYQFGKLPQWVEYYAKTGQLVTDEDLKAKKLTESKEQSSSGFFGKLFGKVDRSKIRTTRIQGPNPKEAAERWINDHPTATIISSEQRSNSMYEIEYTLPDDDSK